jgi:hypothetical protein
VYHNVTRKPPDTDEDRDDRDDRDDRKEKVIHTRVPERLETELRQRAQGLGISVSNLVRNVLGHAFGLVGDIMADGASVARAARGETAAGAATTPGAASSGEVVGWQPIVLARNAVCSRCNAILARGADAAIAIVDGERADSRAVLCPPCFEEVRRGDPAPSERPGRTGREPRDR